MNNRITTLISCVVLLFVSSAWADTYTVNTTADTSVAGGCSTAGPCSLRDAITAANLNPGADHIGFNIPAGMADPGHGKYTITPNATGLPSVTDSVTIDATTQPGFRNEPLVELSGSGGPRDGLHLINHSSSVVRGFVINGFDSANTFRAGLYVEGGGSHVVAGNWFGTDATGLLPSPNLFSVAVIESDYNRFGGETQGDRNIISGNTSPDHRNFGIALESANHNAIEGNWLGLDKTGLTALPNNGEAISTFLSDYNTVGGSETKGNVISATLIQQAVQVQDSSYNTISYNCFGTDKTCVMDGNPVETSPFTNGLVAPHDTILIAEFEPFSADHNRVEHNTIVQNGQSAVVVVAFFDAGDDPIKVTGTVIQKNIIDSTLVDGILLQSTDETSVLNNTIDNALRLGIGLFSSNDTLVQDNTIDNAGLYGIRLQSTDETSVLNNIIDNTDGEGIGLFSSNDTSVQDNTIDNTGIYGIFLESTNVTSVLNNTIDNSLDIGILLQATDDTSVLNNTISASGTFGILLTGLSGTPGTNTQIANNRITNNKLAGITAVFQQDLNIVENVVLKNGFAIDLVTPEGVVNGEPHHGIEVIGEISNVNIVDNWVGVDPSSPADTSLGNAAGGVVVGSASVLQTYPEFLGIPDFLVPQALLVAPDFGLPLGPDSVTIQGNTIAHNAGDGVLVGGDTDDAVTEFCSSGNLCINPLTGMPTILPYDDGIPGAAQSVTMLGNAIYANDGLAIDLTEDSAPAASYSNVVLTIAVPVPDGATANDGGVSDTGPNGLQNYPILMEGEATGNHLKKIEGVLDSAPGSYRVEFFVNENDDPSGHGEGEKFAGFIEFEILAAGPHPFSLVCNGVDPANGCPKVAVPTPLQHLNVTATATNLDTGNTSEFSSNLKLKSNGNGKGKGKGKGKK